MDSLPSRFEALTGHAPFPWQQALFERLVAGDFPRNCAIPTGIGKTSAIAVWLLALATRAEAGTIRGFPRRLVYVVNRRTVVDQATGDVERWRKNLDEHPALADVRETLRRLAVWPRPETLAISTLRGQRADNGEWRLDPARPAVVIGTVDMVGSRLLFAGYRCGFRTKPLHAGFIGQDAWLVHDEAHLEPAFQGLLLEAQQEQQRSRDIRPFSVTALTATSRDGIVDFRLSDEDFRNDVVAARLRASKALALHHVKDDGLVDAVVERVLAHRDSGQAVLVYLRTVENVERVSDRLRKEGLTIDLLTGTLRGLERDRLVRESSVFRRFAAEVSDVEPASGTVCLICTSAGEVGVNMSADHMVCDLTPLDSMVQRLGRVNRFGTGAARIDVVVAGLSEAAGDVSEGTYERARARTAELLASLPVVGTTSDGVPLHDASPAALDALPVDARLEGFTPGPVTLPATDILFDKWALTSIRGRLPGRPPVEAWLHGIAPWDPPQTAVAWRLEVELVTGPLLEEHRPADLLELYPLKPHELLSDRTDRVLKHLRGIAARVSDLPVWVVDEEGEVEVLTLDALVMRGARAIEHATVLLPPSAGGLALDGNGQSLGRLSGQTDKEGAAGPDVYDVADRWIDERGEPRRRRVWRHELENEEDQVRGMRLVRTIALDRSSSEDADDDEPVVWLWFTRPGQAGDEGLRTSLQEQTLEEHLQRAERFAVALAERLGLGRPEASAVRAAARLHDLGKARRSWQISIGNRDYPQKVLAKSGNTLPLHSLGGYRHEFGSVIDIVCGDEFGSGLSEREQELALHLVATHHGRARPAFPYEERYDPERPAGQAADAAREAVVRYGRLQQRYGRWGLAFLESIVRAADALASTPDVPLPDIDEMVIESDARTTPVTVAEWPQVPTFRVRVDLRNPGEFLACCGLLEVAHRLAPGAVGWFEDGFFCVSSGVSLEDIVRALIREEAEELTRLPSGLEVAPLIAPLRIRLTDAPESEIVLDGWMTVKVEKGKVVAAANRPWNFWSGQQTSLRIWRALREALLAQIAGEGFFGEDFFAHRLALTGRFGFDPGAAWNALDVGFSPNEQQMPVASSPAVELFAAVGLQRFRPVVSDDREQFEYSTWTFPLPPCVAAAACAGEIDSGGRCYRGIVVSRGSYAALGTSIPVERALR